MGSTVYLSSHLSRCGHEPNECQERRPDGPTRLPGLRVVAGDGEADLLADFEATVGLEKILANQDSDAFHVTVTEAEPRTLKERMSLAAKG